MTERIFLIVMEQETMIFSHFLFLEHITNKNIKL